MQLESVSDEPIARLTMLLLRLRTGVGIVGRFCGGGLLIIG